MIDKPFTLLARMLQHLAADGRIELPFAPGQRNREWSEHFALGPDPFDREAVEPALLHGNAVRHLGVVTPMRAEPCDWSLDDFLQQMQDWEVATLVGILAILPEILPGERPIVDGVASLDELGPGTVLSVAGRHWVVRRDGAKVALFHDGRADWSLDDLVLAIRKGISLPEVDRG